MTTNEATARSLDYYATASPMTVLGDHAQAIATDGTVYNVVRQTFDTIVR